ncbi:MAG: hypothetical protein DRI89_03750 [Bacteroidetes bacterium]|nr:MAG: hypothetical protein DRI89_03750 [Bacteroidota bacterium]
MKFTDLIKTNSWLSIEMVLIQLYPGEKKSVSAYEQVFNDLKLMEPVAGDVSIVLSNENDDFDNSSYVDVSGRENNPKENPNELTDSLAIEFTPWNEWLGMDIEKNILQDFTELEIIVHCLYEMTFMGFDEEEIQAEMDKLNSISDEYKNMSDEEKKENTISLDDLFDEDEK